MDQLTLSLIWVIPVLFILYFGWNKHWKLLWLTLVSYLVQLIATIVLIITDQDEEIGFFILWCYGMIFSIICYVVAHIGWIVVLSKKNTQ